MTEERMRVLGALARAAARFPMLRLGQLLLNATDTATDVELYYLSDIELAEDLEAYTRKAVK